MLLRVFGAASTVGSAFGSRTRATPNERGP
jgi:hypothetical protein